MKLSRGLTLAPLPLIEPLFSTIALASIGLFVVIWIAYPLTMGLFASVARDTPPTVGPSPHLVSVVIATRDPVEFVQRRVLDILHTEWPIEQLEVVVALDASCRGLKEFRQRLAELGPVRVIRCKGPEGKAAALNAGVSEAKGDVLIFADSNQRFSSEAIQLLVDEVRRERVGAASGRLVLPGRTGSVVGLYWVYETWLRRCESEVHSCIGVTGAVWAMRRQLWRDLPPGLILDDVFAPMRLTLEGWKVKYVPDALAFETRLHSSGDEYKRKVRTLTGNIQLLAWLPAAGLPFKNPVWLQFIIHKPLRLLTPYLVLFGSVSLIALGVRQEPQFTYGVPALAAAVLVWLWLSGSTLAAAARGVLLESATLLKAVAVGGWLGVQGKWNVWASSPGISRIEVDDEEAELSSMRVVLPTPSPDLGQGATGQYRAR